MERKAGLSGERLKSIVLVGVIAAGLGIYVLFQVKNRSDSPAELPLAIAGRPAPEFALPGLDGEIVSLSDFRGKVVFLNIWATWCSTCRQEMPSMEKLYQEMKGQDFEILAVSIDILGAKVVGPFMAKLNLTFPALLDPKGTIRRLYSTTGVPETFVIDKEGIITAKIIGSRDWNSPKAVQAFKELAQKPSGELRSTRSTGSSTPGDRP